MSTKRPLQQKQQVRHTPSVVALTLQFTKEGDELFGTNVAFIFEASDLCDQNLKKPMISSNLLLTKASVLSIYRPDIFASMS